MANPLDRLHAEPQGVFRVGHHSALFCVWAPNAHHVRLVEFDPTGHQIRDEHPMSASHGHFTATLDGVESGFRYGYRLDDGEPLPDPASRWQPDGVHRPAAVYWPEDFAWSESAFRGVPLDKLKLYELHVGTFTPEGTFDAVIPRLPELKELGITGLEIMPIAQCPGRWNWGYDGVHAFAPQNTYGGPQGFQRLVDAAHQQGLAVILDVVYNHFGPEGNYAGVFGHYFTSRYDTPWGAAINFDGPDSDPVRRLVIDNAVMWARDYRVDGLRLDAVHAIYDMEAYHVLEEIQREVQRVAQATQRAIHVIAESNLNNRRLTDPVDRGGYGLCGMWADDFHHAVHTLLTGEREGYYRDFGAPRDLLDCFEKGFVYDGKYSIHRGRRHGRPLHGTPPERLCVSIQNHDQVGNRAQGDRFGALLPFSAQRLAAGLMLVSPFTPMLFMGEEYGEDRPFLFFCDFLDDKLKEAVRRGRREEFAKHAFKWTVEPPDPTQQETMQRCQLSWQWQDHPERSGLRTLYRELLAARDQWPEIQRAGTAIRGTQLGPTDDPLPVIRLVYGAEHPELCVIANLAGTPRPWRSEWLPAGLTLRLSTAEARFGGPTNRRPDQSPETLEPHELLVFGV